LDLFCPEGVQCLDRRNYGGHERLLVILIPLQSANPPLMQLHIQKDTAALHEEMARWIVEDIEKVLTQKDRYTFVLSGGSSPQGLYTLLAAEPWRSRIPWEKLYFFWGDERYVPFTDTRHNGRMAYDTLLCHVPIPADHIHYMNTSVPPDESARQYEELLHQYFNPGEITFDLVLLGMGDDGHTLSLFPGSPLVAESRSWVAAPYVEAQQMYRITLTAVVVNQAAQVAFLVTGEKKAETFQKVLHGDFSPEQFPAQVIRPVKGVLHWFVDEAAAASLP
jgi:6-phosphogluconolactonase